MMSRFIPINYRAVTWLDVMARHQLFGDVRHLSDFTGRFINESYM